MTDNTSLSEKVVKNCGWLNETDALAVEDLKQALKDFKEEFREPWTYGTNEINEKLKKHFGSLADE